MTAPLAHIEALLDGVVALSDCGHGAKCATCARGEQAREAVRLLLAVAHGQIEDAGPDYLGKGWDDLAAVDALLAFEERLGKGASMDND